MDSAEFARSVTPKEEWSFILQAAFAPVSIVRKIMRGEKPLDAVRKTVIHDEYIMDYRKSHTDKRASEGAK